jgi:hypothetical protein
MFAERMQIFLHPADILTAVGHEGLNPTLTLVAKTFVSPGAMKK